MKVTRVNVDTHEVCIFPSMLEACPSSTPYWKFTRVLEYTPTMVDDSIYRYQKQKKNNHHVL